MPLRGVRVLDLSRLLPGPFCSQILGDFGADVIKVEDTGIGDFMRLVPPFLGDVSARFLAVGRNKRSIALNLKLDTGKEVLRRLAREADVLLEGFRPGVLDRLGVGYEALRKINPRLVYCALTGFGQDGPERDRAGHDLNYLAHAGVLGLSGPPGGAPAPCAVQIADLTGAMNAAIGILLALKARDRTGEGQLVDVSMLDGALALLSIHAAAHWAGEAQARGAGALSGHRPGYGVYETADGRWLSVGAVEPKFWEAFCGAIGRPDLAAAQLAEGDEAAKVRAEVAAAIRARPLAAWGEVFAKVEACVAPVLDVAEALDGEQVRARGMIRAMPHPTLGLVHQIGPAIRLSATPGELRTPPPGPGAHTGEILREAGYAQAEIGVLLAQGAIAGDIRPGHRAGATPGDATEVRSFGVPGGDTDKGNDTDKGEGGVRGQL